MSRSVSAVSMARSEYCRCPPRLPTPTASQAAIASGANHTVISPRWTSARSYAGQFPTWYCVLYFGCTLDFMSRSCTCCRHDGQEVDRGSPRARDPCTNAAPRKGARPGWRPRGGGGGGRTPPVGALRLAPRPHGRAGPRSWHTRRRGGPTRPNTRPRRPAPRVPGTASLPDRDKSGRPTTSSVFQSKRPHAAAG